MKNKLEQLKSMTVVVADTGDIGAIEKFNPTDCTTNPTLILKAAQMRAYADLISEAVIWGRKMSGSPEKIVGAICDRVAINFGERLSQLVPGRVSTEVDADLSFDTQASLLKARSIVAAYAERGLPRERVLIKLAATWEGIKAAEILELEDIKCNLTLLFSLAQAQACAQAKVFLISPFVGRILDWHVKETGKTFQAFEDPGVISVREIYQHYKSQNYNTIVMGASFRNLGEIEALAGCDRLTISPLLLDQLAGDNGKLTRMLDPTDIKSVERELPLDEAQFRFKLNEDAMATDKLSEGIRQFSADLRALRCLVGQKLAVL